MKPALELAENILRPRTGPLTSDLVQTPGKFGLGKIPVRLEPDATTTAVCGFCATGCGLNIHLKDGNAINLSADNGYPVNIGMACPKGWEALSVLASKDRATTPLLRDPNGRMNPVDWDRALDAFVEGFRGVQERHGKASVAYLSTGQIATEEMAFLGALAKFGMGMIHGDGNTRQCMATAVSAYKESFGFDAPPYTYRDFEESDALVFVGSNPCIAHPIMWQRVGMNKRNPSVIVIDPRRTETAMAASHHLAIRPKSDLPLLYGIARQIIKNGHVKRDFVEQSTDGFEEFATFVDAFDLETVAAISGISTDRIAEVAEIIGTRERVSLWWTMGVNQGHEATRTAQAIINIALMTGNIGRPGTGANSITGQCNAMGSRLFSNATNLLGGHYFEKAADRAKVARILDIPEVKIPREVGMDYAGIIDGIETGTIKGLWVVATNPAHSWIHQNNLKSLLNKLEFLVVQDMYSNTETVHHANLLLPAAGWGEKEGTFINSERRIGRIKKVTRAPGLALADFSIFRLVADRWGCGEMLTRWESPEAAFREMQKLSEGQPCDFSGIRDYGMIDERGGIQWPVTAGQAEDSVETERRLFEDGRFFTTNGKARFIFEEPKDVPEPLNTEFPLALLTGRGTSSQWHTQTRAAKSAVLRKLYPKELYVEINPQDAAERKIAPHSLVVVRSRRGSIKARAYITSGVQPGQVFLPMHYVGVNALTFPVFDPYSKQPGYKHCAVEVTRLCNSKI